MLRKHQLLICLVALLPGIALAQNYEKLPTGVKTAIGGNTIEVEFYSPAIVRIIKTPVGAAFNKQSLSAIKQPEQVNLSIEKHGNAVSLNSGKLIVSLNLTSGSIEYSANKVKLLTEKSNGAHFTPFDDAGTKTLTVSQSFQLDTGEPIYGLGQHQRGNLDQRNQLYKNMIQGNTDDVVPFFQSIKGYGIFWDNYSPTTFSDTPSETFFSSEVGEGIDYYFMYGANANGVIAQMRELTGQAPMFPLWTFGFWQSKRAL